MKFIKKIFIIILIIVVLILLIALFLPSKMQVGHSLYVKAPAENVFSQVNNFKSWQKWSPWVETDSTMTIKFGEKVAGKGASFSWRSKEKGNGKITLIESNPYEIIKTKVNFQDQGTSKGTWIFQQVGDSTKVTWGFVVEDLGYPLGRIFGTLMKRAVKESFTKGLQNLKAVTEKMEPVHKDVEFGKIKVVKVNPHHPWMIKETAQYGNLISLFPMMRRL